MSKNRHLNKFLKDQFPEDDELRKKFVHILRTTRDKEHAASVLVEWVLNRLQRPLESFLGAMRQEIRDDIESMRNKAVTNIETWKRGADLELEKLSTEFQRIDKESEEADWWKRGESPT